MIRAVMGGLAVAAVASSREVVGPSCPAIPLDGGHSFGPCPKGVASLSEAVKEDSFRKEFDGDTFLVKPVSGKSARFNSDICREVGLSCGGDDLCIIPNSVTIGDEKIGTTAQMHRYNPSIRKATEKEYAAFLSQYAVAIFKTRVFGVTGLDRFNVFVNDETGETIFLDCDGISKPYLISDPPEDLENERTPPIKQNEFQQLYKWLQSAQFKNLKRRYIDRINDLNIASNQNHVSELKI